MPITLAFDIGYASIGWCALAVDKGTKNQPEFLGTGVVTFPTDDCLASQRRNLRRTRRHIRSTRLRIERMKRWLVHRGVLTREDLDRPGHPAPFLLAAAALQGHCTLSAWELWTVLRWYAHNRGYDGNALWARGEEDDEDTQKVANAQTLMETLKTSTMCETVCRCLDLDPAKFATRISSALPYKTLNAAYPRKIIRDEVGRLLFLCQGRIPGMDSTTIRMLMSNEELGEAARKQLAEASIKLPKRFRGGLLFGQLVPRFDNRIIARCPITWAKGYDEAIAAGNSEMEARHLADKFAKVPAAKCREFLEYRFARVLANLKANGEPLPPELRRHLWNLAAERGSLTPAALEKEIKAVLGKVPTNLEAYFKLHPDSAKQLVLDPARDEFRKAAAKTSKLFPIWPLLPKSTRNHALEAWKKGSPISLAAMVQHAGSPPEVLESLKTAFANLKRGKSEKASFRDFDDYLIRSRVAPDFPSGRAPYARPVLRQVVEEVLAGNDPTRPAKSARHPDGEDKAADGVLYATVDPASRVRQLQAERPLEQLTNNHLVRHRLLILDRLVDDILAEFTTEENPVGQVVVEVARELREFSGMTAKQIASELNSRLKDFKGAVAYLEKHAPNLERNGGIIRKCRIAMDMGWKCPFTGEPYDAYDLPKLDREHIIPYATRNSNALHALVLTWPEVNKMKGKRTAKQFIADHEGKPVEGKTNLSLFTLRHYEDFVEKLDTRGHPDDARRKRARKALLLTAEFEDKELGFTDGQLTQSSHLMKLAMGALKRKLPAAAIDPIPGPVTAEIRKAWKLTGTLSLACPEVIDAEGKVRPKDEIRSLTHLHHALDAATLALAAHYFPLRHQGENQTGRIWQALLKRQRTEDEKKFLHGLGIFVAYGRLRRDKDGNPYEEKDVRLDDLQKPVKDRLSRSLAECRVMQHLPADRSGVKAELTTWGIVSTDGEGDDARVTLRQRTAKVEEGRRVRDLKSREERSAKLLGNVPKDGAGKLKAVKGAMIIGENYGLALDLEPVVIPFHDVPKRLAEIRGANGGKPVRVLRNGMLIRILKDRFAGIWMIRSIKEDAKKGPLLDLTTSQMVPSQATGKQWSKRDVRIASALAGDLEILPRRYSGYSIAD
jgi:CRISPR-associated endonuclease Csn1